MEEGTKNKKQQDRSQYTYLSIDQLRKGTNKHSRLKDELQGFFNIKFDLRNHVKESSSHKIQNRVNTESADISTTKACFQTQSRETPERSINISSCNQSKKRLNTEKMLQNISKMLKKEQTCEHNSLHEAQKLKKAKIKFNDETKFSSQYNQTDIQGLSFGQPKEHSPQRMKKIYFQKMLKRCEKLKQIHRYQHELIAQKNLSFQQIGINYYSRPMNNTIALSKDHSLDKSQQNIKPASKKSVQMKLANAFDRNFLEPLSTDKTLDIRKYKNQSVLKKRLKYIIKRNLIKQQRYNGPRRSEPAMFSDKKVKSNKLQISRQQTKQFVGPWEQIDQKYDFQLKLR